MVDKMSAMKSREMYIELMVEGMVATHKHSTDVNKKILFDYADSALRAIEPLINWSCSDIHTVDSSEDEPPILMLK